MTIEIHGRSMYKHAPSAEIYEGSDWSGDPLYKVSKVDLQEFEGRNEFRLTSKEASGGTDVEHDSAHVFELRGAGLKFYRISGIRVMFQAVMLEVSHYPADFKIEAGAGLRGFKLTDDIDDEITVCDDTTHCPEPGHLLMPYMPPEQKIKPGPIFIVLNFRPSKEES